MWLCDEDCTPHSLLKKYGNKFPQGYLHGDPFGTRKMVIDEEIVKTRNFTKISSTTKHILLPTFLQTLQKQCEIAKGQKQPVLVMIFGHGEMKKRGIYIGHPNAIDKSNRP